MHPGVEILVYKKKYKDEAGKVHQFVPDGFVAFVPEGHLGKTWFGMTPEELAKLEAKEVDVTILPSGVAVAVVTTYDSTMQTRGMWYSLYNKKIPILDENGDETGDYETGYSPPVFFKAKTLKRFLIIIMQMDFLMLRKCG